MPQIDKSKLTFGILPRRKKKRRGDSSLHLDYIRGLPCVICQRPSEPHHLTRIPLQFEPTRGMGRKNQDWFAIPLCPDHHRALHDYNSEVVFLFDYVGRSDASIFALKLALDSPDKEIAAMANELLNNKDT